MIRVQELKTKLTKTQRKLNNLKLGYTIYVIKDRWSGKHIRIIETTITGMELYNGTTYFKTASTELHELDSGSFGFSWSTSLKAMENVVENVIAEEEKRAINYAKYKSRARELDDEAKYLTSKMEDIEIYVKQLDSSFIKTMVSKVVSHGKPNRFSIIAKNVPGYFPIRNEGKTWYYATPLTEQQIVVDTIEKEYTRVKERNNKKVKELNKETADLQLKLKTEQSKLKELENNK